MSRLLKAHILLILVTFVWGATFVLIKEALADITPLLFSAARMMLAAAALALIYHTQVRQIRRPALKAGAIVGLFLALGYGFQTTGLKFTTPSKSGFLTALYVVLVPAFLILFWGRKVKLWTAIGVACALVGLYLLSVPATPTQPWLGDFTSVNLGDWLTLICAVAFALHIIFLGRAAQRHSFEQIAFLQVATAAILMLAFAPLVEKPAAVWSTTVIWAVVVTAILATALAFAVQTWAQQFLPPTNTALIFALEPVFAWLTSYVVLHERLGWRAALGAALILVGVLVSEILGSYADSETALRAQN